jgi:WD40 repeat protein
VRSFEGHTHHVLSVSFRHDGRRLVTGGADAAIKVWNMVTGEQVQTIQGQSLEVTSVRYVGFTDTFLATTGDGLVRHLREDGGQIRNFPAGDSGATFLYAGSITPDGQVVAAGGHDSILRLHEGREGKLIAEFKPPAAADKGGGGEAKGKQAQAN